MTVAIYQHAERTDINRYCPYCRVGAGYPCADIDTPMETAIRESREKATEDLDAAEEREQDRMTGLARRDSGVAAVTAATPDDWREQSRAMLVRFHRALNRDATADAFDAYRLKRGLGEPHDPHAWSALWKWAHDQGLIEWTGAIKISERPNHNGQEIRVFHSTHSTLACSSSACLRLEE